ncbi:MAG TPA: hypothetical protein VNC42_15465, partial [Bradyrhizobium sp.]|nr:hypothetical protein [Bradyrhizobium sp.]
LKSLDGNVVWVRVPPPAPHFALTGYAWRSHAGAVRAKRVRRSLSAAKAKIAAGRQHQRRAGFAGGEGVEG